MSTTKQCAKCKQNKSLNDFNFKIKSKGIYQSYCKSCSRLFIKNHYNKNKGYYLSKARKRNGYLRSQLNTYIANYLISHPCVDCGERDITVLEFDHTGEIPKYKAVSHLIRNRVSITQIQEEIDKCVVRCANCHRRKTAREVGWFKMNMHP